MALACGFGRRRLHLPENLPVELFGVKREHRGAALQKGVNFRAVRPLDGGGLAVGAVPENPVSHLGQAFAAVDERRLTEDLAVRIDGGDLMGFG